jgi:competence protein ComEA
MAIRARNPHWSTILVLAVAALAWGWEEWRKPPVGEKRDLPSAEVQQPQAPPPDPSGSYERYVGCQLVKDRLNDGDSFRLRLPDGREETFRLYFVDTPESAFKRYREGESNQQRIQDQADYFASLSPAEAVDLGQRAKTYALELLGAKPVTVFTRWEDPFGDRRFHAFLHVDDGESPSWLHERLVGRGLCRIYTRGADLPDGTPRRKHEAHLRQLERVAKRQGAGGWKR